MEKRFWSSLSMYLWDYDFKILKIFFFSMIWSEIFLTPLTFLQKCQKCQNFWSKKNVDFVRPKNHIKKAVQRPGIGTFCSSESKLLKVHNHIKYEFFVFSVVTSQNTFLWKNRKSCKIRLFLKKMTNAENFFGAF